MTLFILAAIALAFIIGFRSGKRFFDAGHVLDRYVEAFQRDLAVLDEADMSETSNA